MRKPLAIHYQLHLHSHLAGRVCAEPSPRGVASQTTRII